MHQSNINDDQQARNDSEVRIVLLGKTGSGKSSTGNTILGREAFNVEYSYRSVTEESERCYRDLESRTLTVIDTPGLFDTHTYDKVKVQLEKAMNLAYPGVHVFLLVIRVDVKFTKEEMDTVQWFVKILGEEVRKHMIVLFTHGNELKGKTIKQFVQGHPDLNELLANMAESHVFENTPNESNKSQVTELLKKIYTLKKKNKSYMYTSEMYKEVNRKLKNNIKLTATSGLLGAAGGGVGAAVMIEAGLDKTKTMAVGVALGAIVAVAFALTRFIY